MDRTIKHYIRFRVENSQVTKAIAVVWDLEGFTEFMNQPTTRDFLAGYLNQVNRTVSDFIWGMDYLDPDIKDTLRFYPPSYEKFLGDGVMFLWLDSGTSKEYFADFLPRLTLCLRLSLLQQEFPKLLKDIRSAGFPT